MRTFNPKDDRWIRDNFEKLIAKHAGEYIAVANGIVVFGKTRRDVEEKLRQKAINTLPSVMQIPHPESLTCAL